MDRGVGVRRTRTGRALGAAALVFFVGATAGRTSAAFTAAEPVAASLSSGTVALDTGGVQRLTFGGADLTAIGPGASFSQTITVVNESTVTTPSTMTDIALWLDSTGAPADPGGLGAALQVTISRSIGGGPGALLYSGSLGGLADRTGFALPIGSLWSSQNAGGSTGGTATSATYTFTFSLPASSSSGAGSRIAVSFVFEARNRTE